MQFSHPLHDPLLTRGFAFLSSLYVGGQHAAVDYVRRSGPTRGAPIKVTDGGKVVGNGWDFYSGFFVAVDHTGGWRSFYRHLIERSRLAIGTLLVQDQMIGNVGNTGVSQGDHLHFDLWNREKKDPTAFYKNGWWAHDPELYLGKEDDMGMTQEEKDWIGGMHAKTQKMLQLILNHLTPSDKARDSHVTQEIDRVIAAIPNGGRVSVSKETIKQAIRELVN